MKKENTQSGIKNLIVVAVLLVLVIGYYIYLSNRNVKDDEAQQSQMSVAQELLMRDLEQNYPPSPREVLKYFCEIAQCLYGEEYTEEEKEALAMQVQELYDDELAANQTKEQYLSSLELDIDNWKEEEMVISSYSPSSSTDVEEYTKDGDKWAKLYCRFTIRKGTQLEMTDEVFLMRKDDKGHWKIYGWMRADDGLKIGES